jgi:light-regulated signal transduction histidine kinase (bacteriophytochrome)
MGNEPALDDFTNNPQIDLTNCDREPIHIPGNIQPHGLFMVIDESKLNIIQISSNSYELVGYYPEELLNKPVSNLLKKSQLTMLKASLRNDKLDNNPLYLSTLKIREKVFDSIIHRTQGVIVLELEPSRFVRAGRSPDIYTRIKTMFSGFSPQMKVIEFCQVVTEQVRSLTGFDRVVVYKFDEEGRGEVLAESRREGTTSFLGLHYPASDIPKQARALYMLNWLRIISDVNYTPAQIVPTLNPSTGKVLDMSYSVLRSVSPIHIQYLKNMGVGASMSISLLKNNSLWGLIACHHETARFIPYELRTAAELLGQIVSLQLSTREENEDYEYRIQIKSTHARLVELMSVEQNYIEGLVNKQPTMLELLKAEGAAICYDGTILTLGKTPDELHIRRIVDWLVSEEKVETYSSNMLSRDYPEAVEFKEVGSGLLATAISRQLKHYLLWFRPEVIQTVNWGGNPNKPVEVAEDGERLMPRKSFELWKETVKLMSLPWRDFEVKAARDLREAITDIILLRQANELERLNRDLERSNIELDAFSYIASHDLKEPLRGIHNYSSILLADYADQIGQEGKDKLQTLARLTQRMEGLLDSLLYFSRVGRIDFSVDENKLDDIVHQVLDILSARIEQVGVEIRIPRPLPVIKCDRVRLGEVYNNLISNAIKYNDKPRKWIEIGYFFPDELLPDEGNQGKTSASFIFYVKDNGIGIREKHFDAIFQIFKRLHGRDQYGGGAGAGLTITKKIIERHGGSIWVDSRYGEGSTFYFTLQVEDSKA